MPHMKNRQESPQPALNPLKSLRELPTNIKSLVGGISFAVAATSCGKDSIDTPDPITKNPITQNVDNQIQFGSLPSALTFTENQPVELDLGQITDTAEDDKPVTTSYEIISGGDLVEITRTGNTLTITPKAGHNGGTIQLKITAASQQTTVQLHINNDGVLDTKNYAADDGEKTITLTLEAPALTLEQKREQVQEYLDGLTLGYNRENPEANRVVIDYGQFGDDFIGVDESPRGLSSGQPVYDQVNKTVTIYFDRPYNGGDAKYILQYHSGDIELNLPDVNLDFSAEAKSHTLELMEEQFVIGALQGATGIDIGTVRGLVKWDEDPVVFIKGATVAQKTRFKNEIENQIIPVLSEVKEADLGEAPQIRFTDNESEGTLVIDLKMERSFNNDGTENNGLAGFSHTDDGEITGADMELFDVGNRTDDKLVGTMLHEMMRTLGLTGEINSRLNGQPSQILTSIINQNRGDGFNKLNPFDQANLLAFYATGIKKDATAAEALEQYRSIQEKLYQYLKSKVEAANSSKTVDWSTAQRISATIGCPEGRPRDPKNSA